MSESTDSNENTPSTAASVNLYNTYGLATQGFVWAALSSVSGNWGVGHVKTVNGVAPDQNCEVGVASISSKDYADDLNQINSDLSVVMHGVGNHRLLTDVDDTKIRTYVDTVSGDFQTKFDSVCSIIPTEATVSNKLADKEFVSEQIKKQSSSYRGSWSNWTSVPSDSALYPKDYSGSTVPKLNDYMIVLNASDYGKEGTWRFVYSGSWSVSGKSGWQSEYSISQIAFTDEQWKAINSGINSDKLTSIEAASSNWNTVYNNFALLSGGITKIAFEVETTSANNRSVFATVSSASGNWSNAANTVSASSGNWDSVFFSVLESSAKWNQSEGSTKAYTDMIGTSALTSAKKYTDETVLPVSNKVDSVFSSVSDASGNWNAAYTTVSNGSARWNNAASEIESTSANNRSSYSTLNTLSGKWEHTNTTVSENSGDWEDAHTKVSEGYDKWNNASAEIESTSANNRSAYSSLSTLSGKWEGTNTAVAENSANWNDSYNKVTAGNDRWNNASSEIESTSANNRSSYTSVFENSGNWQGTYSKVYGSSGNWDDASSKINDIYGNYLQVSAEVAATSANNRSSYTTLNETSGRWEMAYSTVNNLSSNWESTYGTTNTASGNWDSTYTVVKANSAIWNESGGSTKEYTDMMTTSALSTAKKYTDERYGTLENYATTLATSALTSSKEYTDGRIGTIYDEFKRYSEFTSASALSTAERYADDKSASTLTSAKYYSDFTALSALTSAERYADSVSNTYASSALTSANAYTDAKTSEAIASANIYSSFIATSALTSSYLYSDLRSTELSTSLSSYSETMAASALSTANIYTEYLASSALISAKIYTDEATAELSATSLSSLSAYSEYMATSAYSAAYSNSKTYTDSVSASLNRTVTYTVPFTSTEGISEYSTRFGNANNGDVIILKKELYSGSTDNYRFTSYTYFGGDWEAMNGDYDSKSVFFSENLTTTTDIGNVKVNPATGNAVIDTKGKNVNTVFNDLFRIEKDPIATAPYISSIETSGLGLFETGSTTIPKITIIPHKGYYTYGPTSTSELTSFKVVFNNCNPKSISPGDTCTPFDTTTVTDSMSSDAGALTFSVTGYYSDDSVIPITNLGNERQNLKITEGNTGTVLSLDSLRSYRKAFFGTQVTNVEINEITSSLIRGLNGSTTETPSANTTIVADYPLGAKAFIVAVPSFCGTVESIIDVNGIGVNILPVFNSTTINVNGASGSTYIPYKVYVKNAAEANDIATKYAIRIKE